MTCVLRLSPSDFKTVALGGGWWYAESHVSVNR